MRRFLLLWFACAPIVLGNLAQAQHLDLAVNGSTLFSTKPNTASQAFVPPAERGGSYAGFLAQYIRKNHFGYNFEISTRSKQGLYNGFQRYRPVLYDANAVFTHRLPHDMVSDLMAGAGAESLVFYSQITSSCSAGSGICPVSVSKTHFMAHVGGGLRYYFWRDFFVRPEAHYYRIFNNSEFHSDNLFRAGVSVGYSFSLRQAH